MALNNNKLRITPLPPSRLKEVVALFNPTSYKIAKDVGWKPPETLDSETPDEKSYRLSRRVNAPGLQFKGGDSRVLSMNLFFDVTEKPLVDGKVITDVRQLTNDIVALTRIEAKQKRPPVCSIQWGFQPAGSDFPFRGVLTKLTQDFTLFSNTGHPVRAMLEIAFTEFLAPGEDLLQANPAATTKVFNSGDRLQDLADDAYGDPSLWRVIANANGIDNPLQPPVGQRLTIPDFPDVKDLP